MFRRQYVLFACTNHHLPVLERALENSLIDAYKPSILHLSNLTKAVHALGIFLQVFCQAGPLCKRLGLL